MDATAITLVAVSSALVVLGIVLVAVSGVKKRAARRRARSGRGDLTSLVFGAVQAGVQATAKARELAPTVKDSIQSIVTWVDASRPSVKSGIGADGTVTLLFSDIENSTAINARLGDEQWMTALRAHTRLVQDVVSTYKGQVVKSQGDGFMVAFRQPAEAVHCAIDVQRAMAGLTDGEPLRVRVGVHTGAAIKEDGDFFGANVAYAARVAQQARGGQILVSEAVKDATEDDAELMFAAPDVVELKGIDGPQSLYAVAWRVV